ncbi:dethiobiotin synthetase [Streptomyces leeuwenhoekii]|uniref:ATP-dependent dethiobiotin synthetase BioD n=1 Tax=Streptomyces leeuwenhoekii TaxID=1437453 RepID=A0ABR5HXW5_STRLW|nr:dethiobiotin synthase [Streptomyces leeuwenhoekii]KMS78641.1 dethiobiotin synthetase [Streptomyces leeuwenhoekii]
MPILVITGTGTEVGKTVVTAAVAATALAAGRSVAVLKAAQTGVGPDEPGDALEAARLAGPVMVAEIARFPEPLAPATAARRAGLPPVRPDDVAETAAKLATEHDLVLVEGAGGLLVRFDAAGGTLADAAGLLEAPVLLVATAGLGTLNVTELTARELAARGIALAGVVIGSWPTDPDLACRCNLADLPDVAGAPLLGAVPAGAAALPPAAFRAAAPGWLAPGLDGTWDAASFRARQAPGAVGGGRPTAPSAPGSGS